MEEEERVVKTQGFEISGPRYHEGTIRLQPPEKNPNVFQTSRFLSSCLFILLSTSISLKKCGISHAEVFRIIAGITPFM